MATVMMDERTWKEALKLCESLRAELDWSGYPDEMVDLADKLLRLLHSVQR